MIFNDLSPSLSPGSFTANSTNHSPVSSDLGILRHFLLHFFLAVGGGRIGVFLPCCGSVQLDFSLLQFIPCNVGETFQLKLVSNSEELLQLLLRFTVQNCTEIKSEIRKLLKLSNPQ